ncbi:ATP-binding cassette domain-containing protein [Salinimonas sp. HHU 13199]|uniref:ATP-binding cassette domain-containing protein n=1 Tax=Salinimonas profundi TaxID=2729140 RepID=A0ABR8LIM8_9ALTE|nr:ATP-binding cassette domain-containing protein [Salinimonas profundi]MBD3584816.1 ATP-binding cassette domain-containing protein [Salinimonas profundi]
MIKKNTLTLHSLSVSKDSRTLISVDTEVKPGSITTIMGPSGIGKSLLLAAIAGVLPATFTQNGSVCYDGAELTALPAHKRRLGILFQDPLLFEHMNVAQNIMFGMPQNELSKQQRADTLLADVGLQGYGQRAVQALSGGQQARVALLRTLASAPRAVLLDEPFSKLDMQTRHQTRCWVFDNIRQQGLPCIMVTHDEDDALDAQGPVITITQPEQDTDKLC